MVDHDAKLGLLAGPEEEGVAGVAAGEDVAGLGPREVVGGALEVGGVLAVEDEGDAGDGGADGGADLVDGQVVDGDRLDAAGVDALEAEGGQDSGSGDGEEHLEGFFFSWERGEKGEWWFEWWFSSSGC